MWTRIRTHWEIKDDGPDFLARLDEAIAEANNTRIGDESIAIHQIGEWTQVIVGLSATVYTTELH